MQNLLGGKWPKSLIRFERLWHGVPLYCLFLYPITIMVGKDKLGSIRHTLDNPEKDEDYQTDDCRVFWWRTMKAEAWLFSSIDFKFHDDDDLVDIISWSCSNTCSRVQDIFQTSWYFFYPTRSTFEAHSIPCTTRYNMFIPLWKKVTVKFVSIYVGKDLMSYFQLYVIVLLCIFV